MKKQNHTSHIAPRTSQKGITLIALIITIIVMLILVGVTINVVLTGGLFTKAEEATRLTQIEAEKEELLSAVVASIGNDGKVDLNYLDNNLPTEWKGTNRTYTSPKGNNYTVDENGKITKGNSNENTTSKTPLEIAQGITAENAQTYLNQAIQLGQSSDLTDIGIGTDGNVVNLSYWNCSLNASDNTASIEGGSYAGAYTGPIQDGKIVGTVPEAIYSNGQVFTVTKMNYAFTEVGDLEISPDIPNTVTNINFLFYTNDSGPAMKLKTAPVIHENITSAIHLFFGCENVTGTIIVNATNLEYYRSMLSGVGSEANRIILSGTSTQLEEIRATGNSEFITIEQ